MKPFAPPLLVAFAAAAPLAAVDVSFVADVDPAQVLNASDLDGQTVRSDLTFRLLAQDLPVLYLQSEDPTAFFNYASAGTVDSTALIFLNAQETTLDSSLCWLPTASAGIGITFDDGINDILRLDATVGGGALYHEMFSAVVSRADLTLHVLLGPVTVGPHVGVVDYSNLDKDADLHADLSGDTGLLAGVSFTAIDGPARFHLALDYHREPEFRLQPHLGYTAAGGLNRTADIDMSGIVVGAGLEIVLP